MGSAVLYNGDQMIIFIGGTYSLDLNSNAWTQITTSGSTPAARQDHSAVLYNGDQMIIFGGNDGSSGYLNDTYSLALSSNVWTRITTSGPAPAAREMHSAVLYNG